MLTEHICSIYTYVEVRVTNSSTCYAYIMWAELGHCHFLYVPAVSNGVITGNGTGTKRFKMEPCAWFEFNIQFSVFGI